MIPITGGVALRPKEGLKDVRLIEVTNGEIAVNGDPVSARELRDRVGAAADAIVRLSFLGADQRNTLFATSDVVKPPVELPPVEPVPSPDERRERTISRRSYFAGRPPALGAGMNRETWAHWGPVRSLG